MKHESVLRTLCGYLWDNILASFVAFGKDLETIKQLPPIIGELLKLQKTLGWSWTTIQPEFGKGKPSKSCTTSLCHVSRKSLRSAAFHSALLEALGACCASLAPHCNPGDCISLDETVKLLEPWWAFWVLSLGWWRFLCVDIITEANTRIKCFYFDLGNAHNILLSTMFFGISVGDP